MVVLNALPPPNGVALTRKRGSVAPAATPVMMAEFPTGRIVATLGSSAPKVKAAGTTLPLASFATGVKSCV